MASREIGDLAPTRAVLDWIEGQAENQYSEEAKTALREVHDRLTKALKAGQNPDLSDGFTVEEYARLRGLTVWAVYKQVERGVLEVQRERGGRGIRIPYDLAS